jgi:ParB family chromosome partitioning protein
MGTGNEHPASSSPITGLTAPVGSWFIYFYGTEDGAEVKLGRTKQNPYQRRSQHENQNGHDQPMRTLAVVLGQVADELALKRHFKPWCSRARSEEWIKAGEEMRGYLRWLRSQGFVARRDEDVAALPLVDPIHWLPADDRIKNPAQLRLTDTDAWSDLDVDHVAEGDFYTHQTLIEAARAAMGGIDLDPASCRDANTVVQAREFYSFRENGLLHDWNGRVWLNPPFGNWGEWAAKAVAEWKSGRVTQLCALASSRASTAQHFHPLVHAASSVAILCGRFPFWGPKATSTPDEGHLIFYFGSRRSAFLEAYSPLGTVFSQALSSGATT